MTIDVLARSIAQLGSLTQNVGGTIAVAVTDTQEIWTVDLTVPGGAWSRGGSQADCTLVVTQRALRSFGDPARLLASIEAGELAVLGASKKLQALAKLIDEGPGWAVESIAA